MNTCLRRNVDILAGLPKLQAWLTAYESHPDVKKTLKPPAGVDWMEGMVRVSVVVCSA